MEEKMQSVKISDFKEKDGSVVYRDEDIIVVNGIKMGNNLHELVRMECFLIATCLEGTFQLDINYKTYVLKKGDTSFILPNSILGNAIKKTDTRLRFIVFSTRFLSQVMKVEKETWETTAFLRQSPVLRKEENDVSVSLIYMSQLLTIKLNDFPHYQHREVIRYLFATILCELMGRLKERFNRLSDETPLMGTSVSSFRIYKQFIEMLSRDGGVHRTVGYYADALCYTPKHFSKLVKDTCGRSPMDIITEKAMECIKYELLHTHKSVKEVADDFEFPNYSFFGKYFKKHTGMTPQGFREAGKE